jgi:glycosyltransferase involved in cell wall biosynthesis
MKAWLSAVRGVRPATVCEGPDKRMSKRYCFLTERQVGIGSAAGAIEPFLRARPGVEWTDVTYVKPGGLLERLPLPGRLGGSLRGIQQTTRALNDGRFDALFFLTHNPAVFQQRALARVPTVLWTDVTPELLDAQAEQYDHPVDGSALLHRLKRAVVRRTFRLAKLCVGWSDWARRSFVSDYGVPESQTAVVAPGVNLARFSVNQLKRSGLPRLLFVGGNFVRKGGDLLLDVFRQHLRGRCELDLVTRDAIEPEEGIRVHRGLNAGTPELLALYDAATAFVLPTRGDCYSIASMEAMAKALPVVVTGVGGIPEIVEPGETGFLLDGADPVGLRQAIEVLLKDPARARSMGVRGRQVAEERFDAERAAARLFELMTKISEVHSSN